MKVEIVDIDDKYIRTLSFPEMPLAKDAIKIGDSYFNVIAREWIFKVQGDYQPTPTLIVAPVNA